MPSNLEKRIIQKRRQTERGGILVPLINEFLEQPVGVDTEEDAKWLYDLSMKQVERERIRKESYEKGESVYSPSGLADCMRRVFLSKNHREYGLERVQLPAVEPHFYFLTGDFIHLKWQFVLYKLAGIHPDFELIDCEVPIMSKRGDHGGTLDVIMKYKGEPFVVDVKGLNVRSFNQIDKGEHIDTYRIQLADYMMLLNAAQARGKYPKIGRVERGILLVENKGGPDALHPAALTELVIDLKSSLPEVKGRLEVLREHEAAKEIPAAECESTRLIQFTGCPFASFCAKEVSAAERRKNAETRNSTELRISAPPRRRRSRPS